MILRGTEAALQLDAEADEEPFEATPLAGPWPRYWARVFDLTLGVAILAFIIGKLWPALFVGANFSFVGLILLPFALCLEAAVMAGIGTTAGKAIAGIRVETINHQRPALMTALVRNLRCWVFGLALGVPIVAIGTLMHNHGKLTAGKLTSWDEEGETRVFANGSSLARTFVIATLYILLAGGLTALGAIKPSAHDQLMAEIPGLNVGLPKALDSSTMLDRVSVDASTIIYDYTLTNSDGSPMPTAAAQAVAPRLSPLEASNKTTLCANRSTNLLGQGISMRYRYSAQGGVVVDYTVSPADCG